MSETKYTLPPGSSNRRPPHGVVAEVEHVHARLEEAVDGVARRADDGLVLVEGGVEDDRRAGQLAEVGDELVVPRVHLARDGLQAARAVNVRDRGYLGAPLLPHLVDHQHRRRGVRLLEVVADALFENGRREGAEGLALLDALVEDLLHVGAARVYYDGAVAEGARAELHPPLEPAHHGPV